MDVTAYSPKRRSSALAASSCPCPFWMSAFLARVPPQQSTEALPGQALGHWLRPTQTHVSLQRGINDWPPLQTWVGDSCCINLRLLPRIFLEDFSGHFFHKNEDKNLAAKSAKKNTPAQKQSREKSVLPTIGTNN